MKHVHVVSKGAPRTAEVWQEFVCYLNQFMSDALGAKGGESPFISVVAEKCDLPQAS